MNNIKLISNCVAIALAGAVSASLHAAPVIFSQALDNNLAVRPASQNDTTPGGFGNFAQTFDDFTLCTNPAICTNFTITDVHWTGVFFAGDNGSNPSNFAVTFYQNNAGAPGAAIAGGTFSALGNPVTPPGPCPVNGAGERQCSYSVDLPTPLSLTGGTYWLSIQASLAFPPEWGWRTAGAGNSIQTFFGVTSPTGFNQAFELTGTLNGGSGTAPEPASLALIGTGLAALGFARRRKKA